ncbi:hypothetical protein Ddye_020755 [Dipteronia dyeriana]|uniref:Uncharacterized protein n=1 Tax=Dipteronia dyeriana TaxID=168575 RepID=A0AAD9U0B9_9ROSI|nr:hypothetical protein Ddye_020755 [Dipteronia dyeriana]
MQIKQPSMKLAKMYMKRVSMELELVHNSDRESTQEALLLQGSLVTRLVVACSVTSNELIGSLDESSLGFLRSDNARRYVRMLPQFPKQNVSVRFPNVSPGAVDLLEKMLVFDQNKHITDTLI